MPDPTRRALFRALSLGPALLAIRWPRVAQATMPEGQTGAAWGEAVRGHFTIARDTQYMNTGTLGSTPRVVVETMCDHLRLLEEELPAHAYTGEGEPPLAGYHPEDGLRSKLGALIGANGDELAITRNATMGMNFIAHGLDMAAGDEVLLTDQEHPGGRSGWDLRARRDGIVVREIPISPTDDTPDTIVQRFTEALTPRTRVLAIPHITSGQGCVLPVQRLCAVASTRNIFTVIDGAQAPGQVPVDLHTLGCDAYFSSPHKWLCAPKGSGFLYIRSAAQEHVWTTLAGGQWDNQTAGAFRFMQMGTGSRTHLVGYEATLDFWTRLGLDKVAAWDRRLADRLRAGIASNDRFRLHSPHHPEMAGAMVTWEIDGVEGPALQAALWDQARIRVRHVGKNRVRPCVSC
jgi:isopenicillin-N epimerase